VSLVQAGPGFIPPPNQPGQSAWIPLHHQFQEHNLCVPTSASMILDYFGDPISPREIKELALNKPYNPSGKLTDFSITFFHDLITGLLRRGYTWQEKDYPVNQRGFADGVADIERSLDSGLPVMIDTSPTSRGEGHTFVVAGYSVPDQLLLAIDPVRRSPGIRTVGLRELNTIWHSRAVGFNGRGAVFPQRKSAAR
jgi:hypothetical protein